MPYAIILPLLESCVAFAKKAIDQPSSQEVMSTLKLPTSSIEEVQRDVSITKTTVNNINTSPPGLHPLRRTSGASSLCQHRLGRRASSHEVPHPIDIIVIQREGP